MSDFSNAAHALIIGVGDYKHISFSDLPATERDAKAIAAVLIDPKRCGYTKANVDILIGEEATLSNIRQALEKLSQKTDSQSTVFIFFSGHGVRILENDAYQAYICPREADPDNLNQTAIPGDDFSNLLAAIPAQKMLVILDACHAGGSADPKSGGDTTLWKSGLPDNYYEDLSRGSGRVVIASSKEEQESFIRQEGDFSIFTWHLREALKGNAAIRGNGLIHVLDVFHYVNEKVRADKPVQTPILKVKDLDLNFALALDQGGEGAEAGNFPISVTPVAEIREQIVNNPINGAKALSEYLRVHPEWSGKRNEVDLKRAELESIQNDCELFGQNDNDKAARSRTIYFLLRMCQEISSASPSLESNKSQKDKLEKHESDEDGNNVDSELIESDPKIIEAEEKHFALPANPFIAGPPVKDPRFFIGRRDVLRAVVSRIGGVQPTSVNLVGEPRIGKTSLLYYLNHTWPEQVSDPERFAMILLSMQEYRVRSRQGFFTAIARELANLPGVRSHSDLVTALKKSDMNHAAFDDTLGLFEKIQLLPVICLDEFGMLFNYPEEFNNTFFEGLRARMDKSQILFIVATHHILVKYKRRYGITSPFFNQGHTEFLKELNEYEAEELVRLPESAVPSAKPVLENRKRKLACQWGGAHPYLLQMAAYALCEASLNGKSESWAKKRFHEQADLCSIKRRPILPVRWLKIVLNSLRNMGK